MNFVNNNIDSNNDQTAESSNDSNNNQTNNQTADSNNDSNNHEIYNCYINNNINESDDSDVDFDSVNDEFDSDNIDESNDIIINNTILNINEININDNIDNDSLFALRTHYQDYYNDENKIIQMLKMNLMEQNYSENEANNMLRNFYNYYGIDIDLNVFSEILPMPHSDATILNNIVANIISSRNNDTINYNLVNSFVNILSNMVHPSIDEDDVVCSLDHEEINNLEKYNLKDNFNEKCNICLDDMLKDQEVIKLPCEHIYHSCCISEYLNKYNYKCPVCRKEVGKPKYDL
jgi:hypothetical protein